MQAATSPAVERDGFELTTDTVTRTATAYVFYPGNRISADLKAKQPEWRGGGIIREDIKTLGHRGGYIRQCEITQCRQVMNGQNPAFVMPAERKHMRGAYMINEGGQQTVVRPESPLLFSPWYPAQELPRALGINDGVVELPQMTVQQAREIQYLLFPNWDSIVSGVDALPATNSAMRAYFEKLQINAQPGSLFAKVLLTVIQACNHFQTYGTGVVTRANEEVAEAKATGRRYTYGDHAVLYMEQLGLTRQDDIVRDQASQMDRLAGLVADMVQVQQQPQATPPEVETPPAAVAEEVTAPAEVVNASASQSALEVGQVVKAKGQVGEVAGLSKSGKTATIETPTGEQFTARLDEIEVS